MSWAAIAGSKSSRQRPKIGASQAKRVERISVRPQTIDVFHEVDRRTQVLRKVPPTTTTTSILGDLKRQCPDDVSLADVVEAVVQEPLDRRRYYIIYKSVEQKRTNARRGFEIGNITIPPERADVKGFIPDVPHFMSKDDVVGILSNYGDIVDAKFITFEDTGIRCGGFEFELDLHAYKRLPGQFQILNEVMTIKLKDDIQVCSYCDKVGHLQRHCRKKLEDRMMRAQVELRQQAPPPQDDSQEDDMMEQEERERQEREREEREREEQERQERERQQQEREQQERIERQEREQQENERRERERQQREARERERQLREQEVAGQQPSSGACTASLQYPSTFDSTGTPAPTDIPPGQGTPQHGHIPLTYNKDEINPVYTNSKGEEYRYEDLDEELQGMFNHQFNVERSELLRLQGRTADTLTECEYRQLKKKAWERATKWMQNVKEKQTVYYPFMEERERRLKGISGSQGRTY